jgi:hypothetical protein
MTKYVADKLPPHWLFLPTRRQVKAMLSELGADVRLVEFHGTGYGRQPDRVSLGFVEARVIDSGWAFYLRLWGLREPPAEGVSESLATAALAEIGRYIRECVRQKPPDIVKPAQFRLSFRIISDEITSECKARKVDRYSYPTREWWKSES